MTRCFFTSCYPQYGVDYAHLLPRAVMDKRADSESVRTRMGPAISTGYDITSPSEAPRIPLVLNSGCFRWYYVDLSTLHAGARPPELTGLCQDDEALFRSLWF